MDKPKSYSFGNFPTRIRKRPDLSARLNIELFIKREVEADSIGSGNKVRKLEYLLAKVNRDGYTTVVLDGHIQSSCCLALSKYAPLIDIDVELVLYGDQEPEPYGNYAHMIASSANIRHVGKWEEEKVNSAKKAAADDAIERGETPFIVPPGMTNPVTTFGGVDLAEEIAAQQEQSFPEFDTIVLPVGTGGTAYGLAIGMHLNMQNWNLIGVLVAEDKQTFKKKFENIATSLTEEYNISDSIILQGPILYEGALGDGYKSYTESDVAQILELHREFGLTLDTTYTNKTFNGLKQLIGTDILPEGETVLFIHTGGSNQIFAPPYDIYSGEHT